MKLKYFTSLPHGDGDGLKVAHQMVLAGFPILFMDNGKNEIDLFTTNPDKALNWVDDCCGTWAYIKFTSYYDSSKQMAEL